MPILPKSPILPEGNEINIPKDIDGAFTKLSINSLGNEVGASLINFQQTIESVTKQEEYSLEILKSKFIFNPGETTNKRWVEFEEFIGKMPASHKPFFYKMVEVAIASDIKGYKLQNTILFSAKLCAEAYEGISAVTINTIIASCPNLKEYFETLVRMFNAGQLDHVRAFGGGIGLWKVNVAGI